MVTYSSREYAKIEFVFNFTDCICTQSSTAIIKHHMTKINDVSIYKEQLKDLLLLIYKNKTRNKIVDAVSSCYAHLQSNTQNSNINKYNNNLLLFC